MSKNGVLPGAIGAGKCVLRLSLARDSHSVRTAGKAQTLRRTRSIVSYVQRSLATDEASYRKSDAAQNYGPAALRLHAVFLRRLPIDADRRRRLAASRKSSQRKPTSRSKAPSRRKAASIRHSNKTRKSSPDCCRNRSSARRQKRRCRAESSTIRRSTAGQANLHARSLGSIA